MRLRSCLWRNELVAQSLVGVLRPPLPLARLRLTLPHRAHHDSVLYKLADVLIAVAHIITSPMVTASDILRQILRLRSNALLIAAMRLDERILPPTPAAILLAHDILADVYESG